jgi:hypothetical protein
MFKAPDGFPQRGQIFGRYARQVHPYRAAPRLKKSGLRSSKKKAAPKGRFEDLGDAYTRRFLVHACAWRGWIKPTSTFFFGRFGLAPSSSNDVS